MTETENRWLLQFDRPNSAVMEKIGELAQRLTPVSKQEKIPGRTKSIINLFVNSIRDSIPGNTRPKRKEKDAIAQGNLAKILKALEEDLESDYRENLEESGSAPYKFDYVAESGDQFELNILTRLCNPEKSGNIFYGRAIRRSGNDEYIIWTDR